jgi:Apea-like HEPN
MVSVVTSDGAHSLFIVGHGIKVHSSFELAAGIFVEPTVPGFEMQDAADGSAHFTDYSAVITGRDLADFSLRIESEQSGQALAVKGWNALWNFHLLSLAAQSPVCSIFSMTPGTRPIFAAANRNVLMRRFADAKTIGADRLAWARDNKKAFDALIKAPPFSAAMRCYGNSHYLFDADMRIMLLWSGIEGLLSVDTELTRRIALCAALMIEGSHEDKVKWFAEVKKAYRVRSKAVHGGIANEQIFQDGYNQASRILVRLLVRCVEIGRVPTPAELDALAISSTLS